METVTATLDTSKSLPEKGPLQSYVLGDSISYGLRMAGLTSALHEKLGGKVKISHDAGRSITSPGTQIKKTVMQSIDIDHDHIAHSGVIIIVLGTNQLETSFADSQQQLMRKLKSIAPDARYFWVDIGATIANQAQG